MTDTVKSRTDWRGHGGLIAMLSFVVMFEGFDLNLTSIILPFNAGWNLGDLFLNSQRVSILSNFNFQ